MQRFNMFTLIHKALRALLYDTALTIQQTWFADTAEASATIEKIEDVLFLFEQHAHHEDSFVLPAVELFEPQLSDSFEKEHITDLKLSSRLKNLLNIYRNLNFTEERTEAGSAVSKAFVEFMVFNLEHMAKEEILINKALWKHYTDEQLLEINRNLVASIPQEELSFSTKWMMRGINSSDAAQWLKSAKHNAPAFVDQGLISLAENEMPADQFKKIMKEIGEARTAA